MVGLRDISPGSWTRAGISKLLFRDVASFQTEDAWRDENAVSKPLFSDV
jgi:hypothetical protein